MYSKYELQSLKREFWIAFAAAGNRKWVLYDTKIKDFAFKFFADTGKAAVMLDIEMRDEAKRSAYFEKLESLKSILENEYVSGLTFHKDLTLETGKIISRIHLEKNGVGIGDRNSWPAIFDFFSETMSALETFFWEYEDYIKAV